MPDAPPIDARAIANRRNAERFLFEGEMLTAGQIAARTGVSPSTVKKRMREGKPVRLIGIRDRTKDDHPYVKVIRFVGFNEHRASLWLCKCKRCGHEMTISADLLISKFGKHYRICPCYGPELRESKSEVARQFKKGIPRKMKLRRFPFRGGMRTIPEIMGMTGLDRETILARIRDGAL